MSRGYSNIAVNRQSVLDVPMWEGDGNLAHDVSRQAALDKTTALVHAPAWTQLALSNLTVLSFTAAHPDYLELAAASCTDMDFQVGAFSVAAWIYLDSLAADRCLFCRGAANTDGWYWYISSVGAMQFVTNQAAANQISGSPAADILISNWYFVGATRLTTSVRLFKNGVDKTSVVGAHVNPLTSARNLHIGIRDDEAAMPWSGYIYRPRAWGRNISAFEMLSIYEAERGLFGV